MSLDLDSIDINSDPQIDQSSIPVIQDSEIDRLLSTIDTIPAPWETVSVGPFGIFQSESAPPQENACITWEEDSIFVYDGAARNNTTFGDCNFLSKKVVDSTVPNQPSYDTRATNTCSNESITNHFESNSSIYSHLDKQLALETSATRPSPYHKLTISISKNNDASLLLHHYENHVADLLQPVFHHKNPWKTTYFPLALQGCPDSFIIQNSRPPSGVFSSLFHSLLSAAAFHLRNRLAGSPKYHILGLQHRAKALQALNSGLAIPTGPEYYTVYLTAMLALVTIDVSEVFFGLSKSHTDNL